MTVVVGMLSVSLTSFSSLPHLFLCVRSVGYRGMHPERDRPECIGDRAEDKREIVRER
jgi:hypothetical protein